MGKLTKNIPVGSPYNPNNADIGTYSNWDVDNWTVDFENISIPHIQSVLGESTSDIATLSQSPNINQWALFRPDGSGPHGFDEFLGYNHQANPTTYFYTTPQSGSYQINYSQTTGNASIGFGFPLKRGERPPSGTASWEYVRLKAVVSGDISGTFYSDVKPATTSYENHAVSIDLPDRADRNVTITFTGEYVSEFGSYIKDIEDSSYTITANLYYEIAYADAPSMVADNDYTPSFRHYYTVRTGDVNPTITTEEQMGTVGNLHTVHGVRTGLIDTTSIDADVSETYYAKTYNYTVMYLGGKYYRLNLKSNYRSVGYKYQLDTSNPYDSWHKVNSIESGYNFWFSDDPNNEITELAGWPTV